MAHKHLIAPLRRFVERTVNRVADGLRCLRCRLCVHRFLQSQLLAVHLLRHAVESVVASVEKHLHKSSARSRFRFLLPSVAAVVRQRGEIVPEIGRDAVAHAGPVDIHGVENPVVVIPQSEIFAVNRVALAVDEFNGIALLRVSLCRGAAVAEFRHECRVISRDVWVRHAECALVVVLAVAGRHPDFNDGQKRHVERRCGHFLVVLQNGHHVGLFAARVLNLDDAFRVGRLAIDGQFIFSVVLRPLHFNLRRERSRFARLLREREVILLRCGIIRQVLAVYAQRVDIRWETLRWAFAVETDALLDEVVIMAPV